MKLTKLTMINFRNVEYAEIPLADATFIVGLNGHGKSTAKAAMQMAMHGWCEHTDRRGAGYASLIRTGAREAVIALELGDRRIVTTLTPKSREWTCTDIETGEIREDIASPAAMWAALGINQTHALVCMFPTEIVGAKEFSGILSDYLRDGLSPLALASRLPVEHAAYTTALASGHRVSLESVDGFESLGALAYEKRTGVKRDLKMAEATITEIGFLKPVKGYTVDDVPALRATLTGIDKGIADLRTQLGRAQQAATQAVPAPGECAAAREALVDAQGQHIAWQASIDAEHALAVAKELQADARKQREKAEAALHALETTCPTCGRRLTAAMLAELKADAQRAVEAATQAEATRDAAVSLAVAECGRTEYHGPHIDTVKQTMRTAMADIDRMERAVPYTGPTVAQVEALLVTAGDERALTVAALEALAAHQTLAECTAHAAALKVELTHLEWIVREYHDGAAYRALLAEAAAPIVAAVSAHLAAPLEIVADGKAFALVYDGRLLSLASQGQRALVAYGMAMTFAACGAPVLLDDINNLDPANRGALCMRLRDSTQGSVVLFGTPLATGAEYVARIATALAPMQVVEVVDGDYAVMAAREVAA